MFRFSQKNSLCRQYNLKIHAKKFHLFQKSVRWCGRIIESDGVRMDPAHLVTLTPMPPVTTGSELHQLFCLKHWIRTVISQCKEVVSPLTAALERVYEKCGKRTRLEATRVKLDSIGWGDKQNSSFEETKRNLANLSKSPTLTILNSFVCSRDAINEHCSGFLTKIPLNEVGGPF